MDPISYSKAAQQEQRIKKIIAEPDSVAGLVSVPNLVPTGETITIPAGRTVVHPNLQADGTLDVQGTLFIPSGGTYTADAISISELEVTGTGAIKAPSGTSAERPEFPSNGHIRYNSDILTYEGYSNGNWGALGGGATGGNLAVSTINGVDISSRPVLNETQLKASLNASGNAPIYACRAWVNFNGTGTVAIRASGNVSSITDNGTGNYTVNFTTAMSDANYNIIGTAREDSFNNTANFTLGGTGTTLPLEGSFKVLLSNNLTAGGADSTIICASVFR